MLQKETSPLVKYGLDQGSGVGELRDSIVRVT